MSLPVRAAVHGFAESEPQARALAEALGVPFGLVRTHDFPDGELLPTVPEPARTVIVYRSLDRPNPKLVELEIAAEAWRRLGVERLVLVAPYLAYMRQDTVFESGQAVSQTAIGRMLARNFDRVVTVNAHLHRTHALAEVFPGIEAENLSAASAIAARFCADGAPADMVLAGPDEESEPLVRDVAAIMRAPWFVLSKHRVGDRSVDMAREGVGQVAGRSVVLLDDMVSTGETLAAAAILLRAAGAVEIHAAAVHALASEGLAARLARAGVTRVLTTDSILNGNDAIPLAGPLADALRQETHA